MKVNNYPYLKDDNFLKEIDKSKFIDHYAKIIILNWKEDPIKEIQGRVISGTINLDGSSSMRRTCNLTIYAEGQKDQDIFNADNLISINKKVYLEVGIKNNSNYYPEYPIIWFPSGLYIIIDASIQNGTDGFSISLQLKDKMCLLNGECGGTISAITQFDEYEVVNYNEDGSTSISIFKPTIYQIIQELVNHFGGEQLGKIIINDIDNRIKKVMKWGGTNPIYIVFDKGTNKILKYQLSEPIVEDGITVKRYEYGQDIGYINSDFYYPSELTANAGETVCSVLDKIKNTLGNYEYFYDLEGNFIFQEIKNYMNTSFTTTVLKDLAKEDSTPNVLEDSTKEEDSTPNILKDLTKEDYQIDRKGRKTVYEFDNNEIILSCSRTPQYSNIKNDFLVWGKRTDVNGIEIPIRYHLAIDKKPDIGNTYTVLFIIDKDDNIKKAKFPIIVNKLPEKGLEGAYYVLKEDRNKNEVTAYQYINSKFVPLKDAIFKEELTTSDWRTELYLQGVMAENNSLDGGFYYPELMTEWPKLYDVENGQFYDSASRNPAGIDYYLDFIDTFAKVGEFSIDNIGRRTTVLNDDSVNCIFESDVPDCILIETGKEEDMEKLKNECEKKGQTFYQVPSSIFNLLSVGGQQNSAFESIKNLLFQYTNYNESISITCLPIYHLEPNTRISIKEPISGINGDYIISSMSLPLDSTGTMTMNVTQALERL